MSARIKPIYDVGHQRKSTTLFESSSCVLEQGGKQVSGSLHVIQNWESGTAHAEFRFKSSPWPGIVFGESKITSNDFPSSVMLDIVGLAEDYVSGMLTKPIGIDTDNKLEKLTFHLVNYPDLQTETSYPDTITQDRTQINFRWCEVALEADGWRIILQPLPNIRELLMRAINTQSFAITGIGQICRSDGKPFKRERVIPVLDGLRIFLSFALAEWIGPLLVVGSNARTEKSWRRFSHFEVGQSWYSTGRLDERHGDHLAYAYPGFCRLWAKPEWRMATTQAVTWLIQATRRAGGAEGAIAFCQIPLEMGVTSD